MLIDQGERWAADSSRGLGHAGDKARTQIGRRLGVNLGANFVATAARTVVAPTIKFSIGVVAATRIQNPTNVPPKRPVVIQLTLRRSKWLLRATPRRH